LDQIIQQRKENLPKGSYTSFLFKQGQIKILAKIKEESQEIIKAVKLQGKKRTIEEIADFLYHLMVLMAEQSISWQDLINCLAGRNQNLSSNRN